MAKLTFNRGTGVCIVQGMSISKVLFLYKND